MVCRQVEQVIMAKRAPLKHRQTLAVTRQVCTQVQPRIIEELRGEWDTKRALRYPEMACDFFWLLSTLVYCTPKAPDQRYSGKSECRLVGDVRLVACGLWQLKAVGRKE